MFKTFCVDLSIVSLKLKINKIEKFTNHLKKIIPRNSADPGSSENNSAKTQRFRASFKIPKSFSPEKIPTIKNC